MGLVEFSAARHAGPSDLSAAARLALMALADSCADDGSTRELTADTWAGIDPDEAALGLAELYQAGLVYQDDVLRPGYVWLTFVKGWEAAWEDTLWRKYPIPPRPPIPPWLRDQVLQRDGYACRTCGTTVDLQIDHVHPHSRGGLTVLWNLQALCRSHNASKSNRIGAFL